MTQSELPRTTPYANAGAGDSMVPMGFLRRIPDRWALIFGHFAAILVGLMTWCMRGANPPYRLIVLDDPNRRDIRHLYTYGAVGAVAVLLLIYGLSWWLARRDRVTDFRTALASFCRVLWPACFGLLIIPTTFADLYPDFYRVVLTPVLGLLLMFVLWRFWEWRRGIAAANATEAIEDTHRTKSFRIWGGAALGAAFLYFAWFSYLTVMRHVSVGTGLHDFGIYDHLMWNTINGRPFECAMFRLEWVGYNIHEFNNHFFSEHFIPTFWIITPVYWLFPSSWTIAITQTFFIAAAGVPAFLIAWKKLGNAFLAFLLAFALLNHPLVQQANMSDVHIDTYAPVFILGALASLLYRRYILYWILLVLALGCKQEISVNVALMGIFLFFAEKEHRKTAIATFALGVFWYLLAVQVIIPYYREGLPLRQFERYGHFVPEYYWGSDVVVTPGLVLRSMIENPIRTLGIIIDSDRVRSLLLLIAPFGFLMLFTRWAWLWLLPISAIHILSGPEIQYALRSYYGITLMPAAFVGAVYGAQSLLRRDLDPEEPLPRVRLNAAASGLILVLIFFWYGFALAPGGGRYYPENLEITDHDRLIRRYIEAIPEDAAVSATNRLGGQLAQRRYIYNFPEVVNEGEGVTEYIFLDSRGIMWPLNRREHYHFWLFRRYINSEEWGLVLPYEDGLLLFKRGHPKDEHPITFEELDFTEYRRWRH